MDATRGADADLSEASRLRRGSVSLDEAGTNRRELGSHLDRVDHLESESIASQFQRRAVTRRKVDIDCDAPNVDGVTEAQPVAEMTS